MRARPNDRGFTLAEICVAMGLLLLAATGVAQLFAVAAGSVQSARLQTSTAVLASQKVEALRALPWSDPALVATPPDALDANTPGCVEHLDARGALVGTGAAPPPTGRFIRRWSIRPWPEDPVNAVVLQVLVTTREADARARRPRQRLAGDALVTTILTRLER